MDYVAKPQMTFGEAVKTCFNKYAVFTGRARRSEYWFFFLFSCIVFIVAGILDGVFGTVALFYCIVAIALFLPSLAVLWRRLHDTNHSGWWFLISLIPIIGSIVLLVFECTDSIPEPNQYGESPKYIHSEAEVVIEE